MATSVTTADRRTSTKRRDILRAATEIFLDAREKKVTGKETIEDVAIR